MRTLYTAGIYLYTLGVRIASIWNAKAKQMCAGWKQLPDSIPQLSQGPTAWFHAASLGEFEQARPVLESFRVLHPDYKICVSFFSPSGFEIRKNYANADYICYLPMDTRRNARTFVQRINPTVAFFVKYDFWFNYLNELHKRQVPTYIFSAIFRPSQYFFKWYGGWFRKQLGHYTHLFVQNDESLQLLRNHGISQCSVAGDTRFDRVNDIAQASKRFPEIESFIGDCPVLMAGSSWEPDEANIKYFLDNYPRELKLIVAPHVISDSHINAIEHLFGAERCIRYSQLKADTTPNKHKILIIDNMGMLSSLYRYATVAYIGGGFGRGIHNILEAITFGKPVCFGPNHLKFQEAKDIIARKGGFAYHTAQELNIILTRLFVDKETYHHASQVCTDYLSGNLGATQQILNIVEQHRQ